MRAVFFTILLLFAFLSAYSVAQDSGIYWVFFTDKDPEGNVKAEISERALERRLKAGAPEFDEYDLPVKKDYLNSLHSHNLTPRIVSRWLNAVTIEIPEYKLQTVLAQPYVKSIRVVGSLSVPPELRDYRTQRIHKVLSSHVLDYGESYTQNALINVPLVHDFGLTGEGVLIGIIDSGFDYENRTVFSDLNVLSEYDFYWDDTVTSNEPGDANDQHNHGTEVLGVIGGFEEGRHIGTAYGASYALAKTEWIPVTDLAAEEELWIAAIEWLEGIGSDVVTSSLVYSTFVDKNNYTVEDLDGNTSLITRAADIAASKGVVVVNSAGNQDVWPYVEFPADGDSVITVGAVNSIGQLASFSAEGPTSDGRIKPDVVAMGVNVHTVYPPGTNLYYFKNGASYAAPQAAGVCALILEAHPELSPMQVRDAIRNTADRASDPDNRFGWGLINTYEAIFYHGMIFTHFSMVSDASETDKYLDFDVFAYDGFEENSVLLHFLNHDGALQAAPTTAMPDISEFRFTADLSLADATSLSFYIEAWDSEGIRHTGPIGAPDVMYTLDTESGEDIAVIQNLPETFVFLQNYPNPFNLETTILFELPTESHVRLEILDVLGRELKELYKGNLSAGYKRIIWDGTTENGRPLPSGIYFCALHTGSSMHVIKMVLTK